MNKISINLFAVIFLILPELKADKSIDTTDLLYEVIHEINFDDANMNGIEGDGLQITDSNSPFHEGNRILEVNAEKKNLKFNINFKRINVPKNTIISFDYKVERNMYFYFKFVGGPLVLPTHHGRLVKGGWKKMVINTSDLITSKIKNIPEKITISAMYFKSNRSKRVLIDNLRFLKPRFEF